MQIQATPSNADTCTDPQRTPTIQGAAIQAMLNRANAMLAMDHPGLRAESISFWKGYAKALRDLSSGTGDKMAAKDAASGGYVQGVSKAAWASLTVGLELLSAAQIVERFATQGIEMTTDAAAELRLEAVQHLPHGVVAIVQPNDAHTPTPIDVRNGSGLHDEHLVVIGVDIVAEGGAA